MIPASHSWAESPPARIAWKAWTTACPDFGGHVPVTPLLTMMVR